MEPWLKQIQEYESLSPEEKRIRDEETKKRREKEAQIEHQEKITRLMEQSGLGSKFLKRTFVAYKTTPDNIKAFELFVDYARNFDKKNHGIYAWGPNGIGKTHLSAGVANYLLKAGHKVLFIPITSFKDRIYASYDYDSEESERRIIRDVANNELVIFDDFDKLNSTGNVKELLYKIINRLYEAEKKVVITANCSRAELAKVYDNSIASRIAEMCKCFRLDGNDWRLKK